MSQTLTCSPNVPSHSSYHSIGRMPLASNSIKPNSNWPQQYGGFIYSCNQKVGREGQLQTCYDISRAKLHFSVVLFSLFSTVSLHGSPYGSRNGYRSYNFKAQLSWGRERVFVNRRAEIHYAESGFRPHVHLHPCLWRWWDGVWDWLRLGQGRKPRTGGIRLGCGRGSLPTPTWA